MIYITYRNSIIDESPSIKNVWRSETLDLEIKYKEFLLSEATSKDIVINEHHKNIMNYENNNHLSKDVYKEKVKEWNKFIRMWNFDKFIAEKGNGFKLNYKEIL